MDSGWRHNRIDHVADDTRALRWQSKSTKDTDYIETLLRIFQSMALQKII